MFSSSHAKADYHYTAYYSIGILSLEVDLRNIIIKYYFGSSGSGQI